eukprot:2967359-Amphidinium_carterae.1
MESLETEGHALGDLVGAACVCISRGSEHSNFWGVATLAEPYALVHISFLPAINCSFVVSTCASLPERATSNKTRTIS